MKTENVVKYFLIISVLLFGFMDFTLAGVSPTRLTFGYSGGSSGGYVTAKYEWGVTSCPSWISVSPDFGFSSDHNITITCSPNTSSSLRSGTIVFGLSGEPSASISVIQAGVPVIYTITASAGSGGSIDPSGTRNVNQGGSQTFFMYPNTGYNISNVIVDGSSQGAIGSYTFSNVTSNHSISVSFSPQTYTVTASAGSGGTISPSSRTVSYGGTATFTASPNTGYYTSGCSGGTLSGNTVTVSNVTSNRSVSVSFSPNPTYTVTATAGSGGTISPSSVTVASGGTATFTATPNTGYYTSGCSGGSLSGNTVTVSNVTSNRSVSVSFSQYTYTVTASAGSGGTISPSSRTVTYGGTATFTAYPNSGYYTYGCSGGTLSGNTVTVSNVTSNRSVSVSFAASTVNISGFVEDDITLSGLNGVTISLSNGGGSTSTSNGNYSISVPYGWSGTVTPSKSGYTFSPPSSSFSNVTYNQSAYFTGYPQPKTITASAGSGGSISPSGSVSVNYGGSKTFTITPNTCYNISNVIVDGVSQGAIGSYTFSNVTSNHTISASFSPSTPSTPTLSSPSNGSGGVSLNPVLSWNSSSCADSYTIQVSTSSSFATTIVNTSTTGLSYSLSGLSSSTTYYWRVSASNSAGTSSWSSVRNFTTIIGAPTLASPSNGSTGVSINQTLSWNTLPGAIEYTWQLSTDPGFGTVLRNGSTQSLSAACNNLGNNTTYYWRVRGYSSGYGDWSPVWSFTTIIAAPEAPTLSSPSSGSEGIIINPTLSWNSSSGATSYTIQLSTDSGFSSGIQSATTSSLNSSFNGLSNYTMYYWRVSASNAGGTSAWSSTRNFRTIISAPTLSSPSNGSTGINNPTLSWNTVSGAVEYTWQLSTDPGFGTVLRNGSTQSLSAACTGLDYNTIYYWRVKAIDNGARSSAWSSAWSFTTALPPPPMLSSPSNGNQTVGINTSQVWNSASGAIEYNLQLSTDAGFSTLIVNTTTQATSNSLNNLNYNTVYYWRVKAVYTSGTSSWSDVWSFRTIIPPPAAPLLSSPSNGSEGQSTSPTLSWNSVSGAVEYTLQTATNSSFTTGVQNRYLQGLSSSFNNLSYHTTYYWRVKATNSQTTESSWSDVWSFTTQSAPPPTLSTPADGEEGVSLNTTLVCNPSDGAVEYRFEVSTDPNFTNNILHYESQSTSAPFSGLNNYTFYYWRVKTWDIAAVPSEWSEVRSFRTIIGPPTLSSPANGEEGVSINPTLVCTTLEGAIEYRFELSTDQNFINNVVHYESQFPNAQFNGLNNYTLYYWRVKVWDIGARQSGWSDVRSFKTIISSPVLSSPVNGSQGLSLSPTLIWDTTPGAVEYTYEVAEEIGFTNIVYQGSTQSLSTIVHNLDYYKTYYWRVKAYNVGYSDWSTTWSFTTELGAVGLLSPSNGSVGLNISPLFSWTQFSNPNVAGYVLQISTDSGFIYNLQNKETQTITNVTPNNDLQYNTLYYWRVKAIDDSQNAIAQSGIWSFTTGLGVIGLLSPSNGSVGLSISPSFSWTQFLNPNVAAYMLQISTDTGFVNNLQSIETQSITNVHPNSTLQYNTLYYWRVKAIDDSQKAIAQSGIWSFTTTSPSPLPPTLLSPSNGSKALSINPTFVWNKSAGAVSYTLQVSNSSTFNSFMEYSIADSSYHLTGLNLRIPYYWRVKASNAGGTSAWSMVWSFTPHIYEFFCGDQLLYEYSLLNGDNLNGSLHGIRAHMGNISFLPSNYGGPVVLYGGTTDEIYPNFTGVTFDLVTTPAVYNDTLLTQWAMIYNSYQYTYTYKFIMSDRTLVIRVEADGGQTSAATRFTFDRSEETSNPKVIRVPYLSLFNLLYSNASSSTAGDGVFTSLYADWEFSNASKMYQPDPNYYPTGFPQSCIFTQNIEYKPKTDNTLNRLGETILLTVSNELDDVMPKLNDVTASYTYRNAAASHIVYAYGAPYTWILRPDTLVSGGSSPMQGLLNSSRYSSLLTPLISRLNMPDVTYGELSNGNRCFKQLHLLSVLGVRGLSVILKNYQYAGYDRQLPDVFQGGEPANPGQWIDSNGVKYPDSNRNGGSEYLEYLRDDVVDSLGYGLGFHQQYVDGYLNAPTIMADNSLLAMDFPGNTNKNTSSIYQEAWRNPGPAVSGDDIQSYLIKPTKAYNLAVTWASNFQVYNPTFIYCDVHSAKNLDDITDYDVGIGDGAGKFITSLNEYRRIPDAIRTQINSPDGGFVQGEGGKGAMFHAGYFDAMEARLLTADYNQSVGRIPLFIDFCMKEMHPKTVMFGPVYNFNSNYVWDTETVLSFIATEFAYGFCGEIAASDNPEHHTIDHAILETTHHYPVQKLMALSNPTTIEYYDGANYYSASDYIKYHSSDWDDSTSPNFMSRVRITYNNGIIVCVNRNLVTGSTWTLTVGNSSGWFSYHADNGSGTVLDTSSSLTSTSFTLPAVNGWVVYVPSIGMLQKASEPKQLQLETKNDLPKNYTLEHNYPNPFNPTTTIKYQLPKDGLVTLKIYDILGREVAVLVNEVKQAGYYQVNFNAGNLASGVYFYQLRVGYNVSTKKMILLR